MLVLRKRRLDLLLMVLLMVRAGRWRKKRGDRMQSSIHKKHINREWRGGGGGGGGGCFLTGHPLAGRQQRPI